MSPNQSCKVFGDFGPKSWLTQDMFVAMWHMPHGFWGYLFYGPWAVDNFRHRNFSIFQLFGPKSPKTLHDWIGDA